MTAEPQDISFPACKKMPQISRASVPVPGTDALFVVERESADITVLVTGEGEIHRPVRPVWTGEGRTAIGVNGPFPCHSISPPSIMLPNTWAMLQ